MENILLQKTRNSNKTIINQNQKRYHDPAQDKAVIDWTDGWVDRQTDGWVGGRTGGWMDGRMGGWTYERVHWSPTCKFYSAHNTFLNRFECRNIYLEFLNQLLSDKCVAIAISHQLAYNLVTSACGDV